MKLDRTVGLGLRAALAGKTLLGFDTRAWAAQRDAVDTAKGDMSGRKPVFGGAKPVTVGSKPRVVAGLPGSV